MSDPYVDPVFGALRADANGYWCKTLAHGVTEVELDMTIDGAIDPTAIARLTSRVQDLAGLEADAREALLTDAEDEDSAVLQFRQLHVDRPHAGDLAAFVASLHLSRVGLYPEDDELAIVADFTVDAPAADQLLSVCFDRDGDVTGVNFES